MATSIAAMVNAVLLYRGLRTRHGHVVVVQSWMKLVKIVIAAVIAVGVTYAMYGFIEANIDVHHGGRGRGCLSVGAVGAED